ncbi:ATPase, BadF/BadG/BcrA/BcrD type [Alkaliphilus metalliredigens QYMF]|uniref:ATPase, BadF/BadG/BcrA/BcrD type n=1 Tax=Alkaliphilus metalliredigens (strain QYMF) TaxID=293826 RepID=A6TVQ4_ALKMQ|nr:BadF/BadG/BcrA/BcrD ATPase family protein [Alkaliphilus metalliredigens]ABR50272.1 ATPase, BadF/BadG/BcrA/BcrD type [Alkaliphilus metalliredigens QYMF]
MGLLIGIDGGGTKTIGYMVNTSGETIARERTGSLNIHSQGIQKVEENFCNLISILLNENCYTIDDIDLISLGVAGIGREEDRLIFENILEKVKVKNKVLLSTDVQIALVGANGNAEGIFVLSGTGSIAYGIDSMGQEYRAGGWGHILGDEGSGYDIGRNALATLVKVVDGREQNTSLTKEIIKKLNWEKATDVIGYVHHPHRTKADIARITPVVQYCADCGDDVSTRILQEAAESLCELSKTLIRKMPQGGSLTIKVGGGVLENVSIVYDHYVECIKKQYKYVEVSKSLHPPVVGALILGFKRLGISFDSFDFYNGKKVGGEKK